jgi:hypothetical protein
VRIAALMAHLPPHNILGDGFGTFADGIGAWSHRLGSTEALSTASNVNDTCRSRWSESTTGTSGEDILLSGSMVSKQPEFA